MGGKPIRTIPQHLTMPRRSGRGQPSTEVLQVKPGVAVLAQWKARQEWAKAKCIDEKVDSSLGQMFRVQYVQDNEKEWLAEKHVKARTAASDQPQVTSPPTSRAPKKTTKRKADAQAQPMAKKTKAVPEREPVAELAPHQQGSPIAQDQAPVAPLVSPEQVVPVKTAFSMGASGRVTVPTLQAYALSNDLSTEAGFQAKRCGDLRKLQIHALQQKVPATRGFSDQSPFCDLLNRGHKLIRSDDVGKVKYLNALDDNGLKFKLECVSWKGTWFSFATVRVATHHAETEVSPPV
jgi:hypothetical protein